MGIEIGNEPDAYAQHGLRNPAWSPAIYASQVSHYRRSIERATHGVALVGPSTSGSHAFTQWGPAAAAAEHPVLLTGHHYPLGCRQVPAPSIALLLSPRIRRLEAGSLERYLRVAAAEHLPFRLEETGSVSCGGRPTISNTFAATLWALDYTVRAMSAGAAGINFHGNLANCEGYSPLCAPTPADLSSGILTPQPEWYGLLAAHTLIGEHVLSVSADPSAPQINVAAFLDEPAHLMHVVLIDESQTGGVTNLQLHLPRGFTRASVLALTAPSLAATAGLRIGGHGVASDGSWWSSQAPVAVGDGGTLTITVAAGSAAVISLR
jgi:hypothetical protein